MATGAATTTPTSSSATASSPSPPRWISQSSRNFGERALPPPPRTFTPPIQTPPRIPEYHDELLVNKVEALVGRALPSPPKAPTPPPHHYDHHGENIYEEITDDFILKALQRNRIKMAQKSVPNREDDYGFVCQAPELLAASDVTRKLNQNVRVSDVDMQTMIVHSEDTMIIPPDAKYNAPRSSGRNFAQSCLNSSTLDASNLSQDQVFGFPRDCGKSQAMAVPVRSEAMDHVGVSLRMDNQDSQRSTAGYPPPPSYSQSQQPLQNFLPHCHPASQPEHYMCMTQNSHFSQSSTTTLNPTSVLNVAQSSHMQQSQHSMSQVNSNPPLPPKLPQQTASAPQQKYQSYEPPPPSYPGTQHPALPPRQNQTSLTQAYPGHHRPPPDYSAYLNQRPPIPNPRQNMQSNPIYPPNYPSNLLPSQSVPNLHNMSSSQLSCSSSLLSSSSSTLSSQSQIFYTPGTQPPPSCRLRPCHTPTETDPTWCPYGSRPPSSLYMSDSSATYSAGSDSGISVCSERGHPLAASIVQSQMHPDHQRARTDLDCSRLMNQMGQCILNERRHSLVNLNESHCSDYLTPNCVHVSDEGFSESHCYHQQLQQQQMHQQAHQHQIYEQHLQQQKQIQEQRLRQLHEQQMYEQHLQLQQKKQEELRILQQQQMQQRQHQQHQQIQQQQQQHQMQQQVTEQNQHLAQQQQEESNFVQRAREKIYQKLKHLDLAHPDYNQLEFSPVPWSPPPSEAPEESPRPPPLPPPREPSVFKSISLSGKGLQHLDPTVLTPSKEVPPPLPARLKRVHLSRKPLPVVPQEKEEDELETKSCDVFEGVKPIEYKGDDIIGIAGGLDRLQVFHRQQGARKVIPRAHSTDTESEYGSRANSRDMRSSAKDKRSKGDSRTKSKESRTKSRDSRSVSKDTRDSARDTTRASSSDRRSQSRRRRAKSLDKRSTSENKERRASSSSGERPPPPPLKTRHSSGGGKASRPPPLSVRNVSDSSYEERSPGVVNGTLSDLLRRNHDRLLLV